jgi:hypothetical protein
MPNKQAHELLKKHNISIEEMRERRPSLHHLRHMVKTEDLPFDVFRELVRLRK